MSVLERGGERVGFDVQGPADAPVVVLAHNLLCDRDVFAGVVARLADRARLVRVDARGHGESTARRAFTTTDLAHDLLAVLDAVGAPRATFVGVSLGAAAALEAALVAPGRVRALVLMGVNPRASTRRDALKNTALAALVRALGWRAFVLEQARAALFGRTFQAERPDEVARWASPGGRIASLDRAHTWRAIRCWVTRPALEERLRDVVAPTSVVAGDEDAAAAPELAEVVRMRIPGAALERVRAGHTVPLERPDVVAALVERFL